MPKRLVVLMSLALSTSFAWGQVPVQEGGYGGSGSVSSPAYGSSGAAYAGDGGSASAPVSAQGQLFMQLQQMQDAIARLRGQLEEQQNEINQLKQQGLERYQDLDRRISASEAAGAASQSSNVPTGDASGAIHANAAPVSPVSQSSSEPGDPAKEKLYYDAAFDLIKAKDFAKASQAFNAFLRKYPNSQYAGNAQYWLGEVNMATGDLQAAGQAFARVSQAYPNHPKVPDSLYKLAGVEQRLGNRDRARAMYQQVIAQYPNSSAAQLAQRDMKSLP